LSEGTEVIYDYLDPEGQTEIPELDVLARIKDQHMDLFDHPVISSIIWLILKTFFKGLVFALLLLFG
jgi:hypothetical protein